MDSGNKFWRGVLTGVLVTAFVCLVTVGTSIGIYMFGRRMIDNQIEVRAEQGDGVIGSAQDGKKEPLNLERVTQKLRQLEGIVDECYLFQDKEDSELEEAGIYKGYIYGLNDPYAAYYTKEELASFMDQTTGSYYGIGAVVSQDRQTGIVSIIRVFENSPAAKAGIRPGDIIFAVDGEQVTGMDLTLLVNTYVKGKEGTKVTITVYREEKNEYTELNVTRGAVDTQTVEKRMLENDIGYMLVTEFDSVTAEQFKKGIEKLQSEGMKKLIIDLRNNPGGDLECVTSMMDYVLPDGKTLVTIADRNGTKEKKVSGDGHTLDIPIVILVNGNSASASEVFTGALRDYKFATVVGTTTFGKGIVQSLYPLSDGSAVKLTMAHYYTPNGTDLHGVGIEPDVKVELDEEAATMISIPPENDAQLQEALKIIREK